MRQPELHRARHGTGLPPAPRARAGCADGGCASRWMVVLPLSCGLSYGFNQPRLRLPPPRMVAPTIDEVITESLNRHALRLQRVEPPEQRKLLQLQDARADDWRLVVDALAPFLKEKKIRSFQRVLELRRATLHVLVENVADPHNAQSLLRTAEALGVQHVHVVEAVCQFQLPAAEASAVSRGGVGQGNGSGEGAARWLSLHKYRSTAEALAALRARGVAVYVSDCPTVGDEGGDDTQFEGLGWQVAKRGEQRPEAVPIGTLDFARKGRGVGGGVALAFGNERRGCSRALVEGGDGTFYLPMTGFTQSFNIGVAVAMSLAAAIDSGAFPSGSLTEDERAEVLGRWLIRDLKAASSLLSQAGLEFEDF